VRVYFRLATSRLVILTALILLLRAPAATDEPFGGMFVPPRGCAAPCFIGIRLNETVAEDAVAHLEAHPWVGEVELDTTRGYIRWNWGPASPRYLNHFRENQIVLQRETMRVATITLRVDAPTGAVWRYLVTHTDPAGLPLDRHIRVDAQNCIDDPLTFWTLPAQRVYYSTRPSSYATLYRHPNTFNCD